MSIENKVIKTDYKVGDKVRVVKPKEFEGIEEDLTASTSVTGKFQVWSKGMDWFVGKVFTLEGYNLRDGQLSLDDGEMSWCFLFEWVELVEEEAEKMKPQDLWCFKEVAKVIGEGAAEVELQTVIDAGVNVSETSTLFLAFTWITSPQGGTFWKQICNGEFPEEYQGTPKHIVESTFNCIGIEQPKQQRTLDEFLKVASNLHEFDYAVMFTGSEDFLLENPSGDQIEVSVEKFFEVADKIIQVHEMFK